MTARLGGRTGGRLTVRIDIGDFLRFGRKVGKLQNPSVGAKALERRSLAHNDAYARVHYRSDLGGELARQEPERSLTPHNPDRVRIVLVGRLTRKRKHLIRLQAVDQCAGSPDKRGTHDREGFVDLLSHGVSPSVAARKARTLHAASIAFWNHARAVSSSTPGHIATNSCAHNSPLSPHLEMIAPPLPLRSISSGSGAIAGWRSVMESIVLDVI